MCQGTNKNHIHADSGNEDCNQKMSQTPRISPRYKKKDIMSNENDASPTCPMSLDATFSRLYSTETASSMKKKGLLIHDDPSESVNDSQRNGTMSTSRRLFVKNNVYNKNQELSKTAQSTRNPSLSKEKNTFFERLYKKETQSSLGHKSKDNISCHTNPKEPIKPKSSGQVFDRLFKTKTSSSAQKYGRLTSQRTDVLLTPRVSPSHTPSSKFERFNNIVNASARRIQQVDVFTPQAKVRSHSEMMATFERLSSTTTASSRTKIHTERELILDR